MKVLYTTKATSQGGRNGKVKSENGVLDLQLGMPKELGGRGDAVANPEMLFAAGYAACFENAILHVASLKKIKLGETAVAATVGIGANEDGGFALSVALEATIGGVERAAAEELLATAHQVCPYSNATRGNIEVTVKLAEA